MCDVTVLSFQCIDSDGKNVPIDCVRFFECARRAQYNLIAFQYIESRGNPMKICNEIFNRHMSEPIEYTAYVNQYVHGYKSCTAD